MLARSCRASHSNSGNYPAFIMPKAKSQHIHLPEPQLLLSLPLVKKIRRNAALF
ncbi:hypothetical protein AB35_4514 [Escherichia coli 2-474-04_S1_C2]|nr:hypothetical protein HMPREF9543_04727 [Escherichia coli MS 146-1]EKK50688.1 hypothetical protein EC80566_4744 [Escherichia coli 8.0566]KDY99574.1 hypothetical protein AB35_4514 [Escherichia coli 2-474-04_S1_C2]